MSLNLDPLLRRYCEMLSSPDLPVMEAIERATQLKTPKPHDASDPIQGRLLRLLSTLAKPKFILEIGTMSAVATINLAKGLVEGGKLTSIEYNYDLQPLIHEHLTAAGVEDSVNVIYGIAMDVIPTITNQIDILYIDAAKREYKSYVELLIDQVNIGGLIITDNVLWKGEVVQNDKSTMAQALDNFNHYIKKRKDLESVIIPYRDGLSISRKIS
ncbi:MAG: caffeoyl-CoA O-methyltransferase [Saprospiraceae bacterium]|jgi:caffeoyl-CoA O-methyltransferase